METLQEEWALELGANITPEGTRFRVWAPRVSSVSLKVMGQSSPVLMQAEEGGYFTAQVERLGTGARYLYLLDGKQPRPDPVSRYQPEGVHESSEVISPGEFPWKDQFWKGILPEKMIIYEVHTGTFTLKGTFEAIIPYLDYLKNDLGVTALELMPVGQFPGGRNWGYDGTYLYAPQNSYGGPWGLKNLINASHLKGLAVLLDVVYNHLGPEGNYLSDFGAYFTDRYKTPWGPAFNFDGPESDEVRRFIIDNALYWVNEYHLDGLRLDAIHGIFDFSARHIVEELGEAVHRQAKRLGRRIAVIAESNLNDVRVINSSRKGGYGLDAQWNDDFHHALHVLLTKEQKSYYQDFGGIDPLAQALRDGFVYTGQYSSFRKRRHGSPSKHLPPTKFVIFSQNHDQVGNRSKGERLSTLLSFEALKLTAGTVLLSPNIPLLFMGEEYGEEAPFLYFVSHSDPSLIEAVRKGRKEEFADFHGEGELPDPQDERTFFRSKMHLDLHRQEKHKILFDFYRDLINLRKKTPSLSHSSKAGMEIATGGEKPTLFMLRKFKEDQAFCLLNFDEKPQRITFLLSQGLWQKVFDSSSAEWDGPGCSTPDSISSSGSEICLDMAACSFVLYRAQEEK